MVAYLDLSEQSVSVAQVSSSPASVHPTSFTIPDLISYCPLELRVNRNAARAIAESKDWFIANANLTKKRKAAFLGLKAGELASICYPDAQFENLRTSCDIINYGFHIDDISDEMDHEGTTNIADDIMNTLYHPHTYITKTRSGNMMRDCWKRFILTGSPGAQQRFMSAFDQFLRAINVQAVERTADTIPDLESYINVRRDGGGCKPIWVLIEYANNLDLPDEVMDDPIIRSLEESANDLVCWSNDIYSYNREQAKGDTHNMITVVMTRQGLDLQSAVEFVGNMCKKSIDQFIKTRKLLPSWSPEIDKQVEVYVTGLAHGIVGNLNWSFDSERYFEKIGQEIKATKIVKLAPRRA